MSIPRSQLELQLGLLLRRSHRRAAQSLSQALGPLELDGRHFGVMMTLLRRESASQRELIAAVESDKSTMVRTVDDLVSLGIVVRAPSPTDRRVQLVSLTPTGRATAAEAIERARTVAETVFARLSDDEIRVLGATLEKFLADN
jgi:DNA-binding MarR family transcriptional regulator